MRRPIGIDLFAGAGGMSLGFEQAGFDIAAAVEIDPIHACVHEYNFPYCSVIAESVIGLSAQRISERIQHAGSGISVVFGGAPCQGFSLIGHRAFDDPRNALVKEFVRLVAEIDATYFVFENVKGLTVGRHIQFLEELVDCFASYGYQIVTPWKVLNSVNFGVPQSRERLFLLGAKRGYPLPKYPHPTTKPPRTDGSLFSLLDAPTCREAIGDLPEVDEYSVLNHDDQVIVGNWAKPSEYARKMRCMDSEAWHNGYRRPLQPELLTSSMRTHHTPISRRRFMETPTGQIEPISRFYKLPPDGVSNTLRAGTDSSRGAFTSPRPIHYEKPRCITVREMARLHGFPDWFRFHRTKWHGARQIGNAVPPPLAFAVASEVAKALGYAPVAPEGEVKLGDPRLLQMGMSEAAKYWGIENPIGRRDRLSGAKKRKQEEIERIRILGANI